MTYNINERILAMSEPRPAGVGQSLQRLFVQDGVRGVSRAEATTHYGKAVIHIHSLQSIDYGGGRATLKALIRLADELGVPIRLQARPYATVLHRMPKTQDALVAYYESFGFQPSGDYLIRHPLTQDNY
jgi:hypothetical protein